MFPQIHQLSSHNFQFQHSPHIALHKLDISTIQDRGKKFSQSWHLGIIKKPCKFGPKLVNFTKPCKFKLAGFRNPASLVGDSSERPGNQLWRLKAALHLRLTKTNRPTQKNQNSSVLGHFKMKNPKFQQKKKQFFFNLIACFSCLLS